jgi:hypothetical protein
MQTEFASITPRNLPFDFFKGEETTVDPPFSLTKKRMSTLDGIHISLGIGQKSQRLIMLMNTQAQDSVFGQIDIFIIEQTLLSFFIRWITAVVD